MQKKLIALAVASALTVPALALADTSNVSVYGIADVSFDSTRNGGTNGVTESKISSNSSRLGLKGSEDLGGGLKAIWQVESDLNLDKGGDTIGTRNTFLGLAGDSWGSFTMGKNDTPYKSATRGYDVFMDHIADNRSLMGRHMDVRNTDTMRYDSPDISGFKVGASYTAGAENNVSSAADIKGKVWSLSGNYATGPFSAAVAYQKNTYNGISNVALLGATGPTALIKVADEKAWKIGGGYKDGQFAVNGVYEKTTDNLGVGGFGHKAFYLAGVFNATASDAIKLAYTKSKNMGEGSMANTGAKQLSLGVDHSLSKRTTVYAMYTRMDNDSGIGFGLATGSCLAAPGTCASTATGNVLANGAGADPSAFSIGMKHTF